VRNSLADFLSPEGFTPPPYWALAKELGIAPELGHAAARAISLRAGSLTRHHARRGAVGNGEPVLLLPGFLAGDYSLRVLSGTLRSNGYRTYRSTIRTNVSCVNDAARQLERRLETIVARREQKVRIVGHSLGGMLGRGLAVRRPDLVSGVIAMGSPLMAPGTAHPILMSAAATLVRLSRAGLPGLMSEDCVSGECARTTWQEFHGVPPEQVDFSCIYSRWDGLVDWRSCIHPDAHPVEVRASHIGMAISPIVADRVLAELLRQREAVALRAA
jgi:pimeloyl-ACP methyl ester carboxylesterase